MRWLYSLVTLTVGLLLQYFDKTKTDISAVISGRDAWIQADVNRYAGANKCTLWKAFASRGLGSSATTAYVDSTTVPAGC
jgi:hypothetical protein